MTSHSGITADSLPPPPGGNQQLSVVPPLPAPRHDSVVQRVCNRVVPGKGKLLILAWLLAILVLGMIFSSLQGTATHFYGVAETETKTINFRYPVEIVDIPVVAGQAVDRNSRIVEVRRYDLDIKLAVIDDRLAEIRAEQAAVKRGLGAEIARLQAERRSQQKVLENRIHLLQTRYQLHQALADPVSGGVGRQNGPRNLLALEIEGLNAERALIGETFETRIEQLQRELVQQQDPYNARIAELSKQRNEFKRQSRALVVRAPFAGSIAGVMYRPGEQIAAFEPILSMLGVRTLKINGFIHEAIANDARPGQTVWIQPLDASGNQRAVTGRIESLGNRIVEYPDRLKRNLLVSAWGREVVVAVDSHNDLLAGEKVSVLLEPPRSLGERAIALADQFLPVSSVMARVGNYPKSICMTRSGSRPTGAGSKGESE